MLDWFLILYLFAFSATDKITLNQTELAFLWEALKRVEETWAAIVANPRHNCNYEGQRLCILCATQNYRPHKV